VEFGINFATYGFPSFNSLLEASMEAEKLGFDALWVPDHLFLPERVYRAVKSTEERDILDAWTTLAAMAVVTKRVKLGPCVAPIPLRNPALLAKTVATLDNLSRGRFILGAGAGWFAEEFRGYGVPWDSFPVRIAKMREGIAVMKKLWTEASTSHQGCYYTLKDAALWPKPVQRPHPPVWFGGKSDAILETTAELGDGWISFSMTSQEFKEKSTKIGAVAEKLGQKSSEIKPACCLITSVSEDYDAARGLAEYYVTNFFGKSLDQVGDFIVYGKPDDCIQNIEHFVKAGAVHVALRPVGNEDASSFLKLYGKRVIPYFKEE